MDIDTNSNLNNNKEERIILMPINSKNQTLAGIGDDLYVEAKKSFTSEPLAVLITLLVVFGAFSWVAHNIFKLAKQELFPLLSDYVKANHEQLENSKKIGEVVVESHSNLKNSQLEILHKLNSIEDEIRELKNIVILKKE